MAFNPSDDYGDEMLCLAVEGEFQGRSLKAYSSADATGHTYFDDGTEAGGPVEDEHGAPFKVDIVLHEDVYPEYGQMKEIRDEVGDLLSAQFDRKVDTVFDAVSGSDDPLGEILDLDADEL